MSSRKGRQAHTIRIVGGALRGRRIPVLDLPGLRPTPERVRETLFNWLQPYISGSRCLDLFAGTGALALEAASRGAENVIAVERDRQLAQRLNGLIEDWRVPNLRCVQTDALTWLSQNSQAFDVVFLDPPFDSNLLSTVIETLTARNWLAANAFVYVEYAAERSIILPPEFELFRSARAGQVAFGLYRWSG